MGSLHLQTKHNSRLDILFPAHFSSLHSFPAAACGDPLLSRSSRQFLPLNNIGGLLCHCEELRERSACQAVRIIRINGGKLGATPGDSNTPSTRPLNDARLGCSCFSQALLVTVIKMFLACFIEIEFKSVIVAMVTAAALFFFGRQNKD